MEMSRITSKYQATVPADVRAALGVKAGDRLSWQVDRDGVTVRRALQDEPDLWHNATLVDSKTACEWLSDEDEEAFRDL